MPCSKQGQSAGADRLGLCQDLIQHFLFSVLMTMLFSGENYTGSVNVLIYAVTRSWLPCTRSMPNNFSNMWSKLRQDASRNGVLPFFSTYLFAPRGMWLACDALLLATRHHREQGPHHVGYHQLPIPSNVNSFGPEGRGASSLQTLQQAVKIVDGSPRQNKILMH